MKALIVEDDFTSRVLLQELLKPYGATHIAVNGREAVEAARTAIDSGEPYALICLDIMMPEMDGQEALKAIREIEDAHGVVPGHGAKIVMATALSDFRNRSDAYFHLCDAYLTKPIRQEQLREELRSLGLIPEPVSV